MKKYLLLLAAVIISVGCIAQKKSNGYTLTGTCALLSDNDKVFLCAIGNSLIIADSTFVKDGKFTFTGSIQGADLRVLVALKDDIPVSQALIVLENADISVKMPADNTPPEVLGSRNYDLYTQFSVLMDEYTQKSQSAWEILSDPNSSIDDRIIAKDTFEVYNSKQNAYAAEFIYNNIPNLVSDMLLKYYYQDLSDNDKKRILDKMKKEMPNAPNYQHIIEEMRINASLAVGKQIIDIELNDMDGKPVKLSDIYSKNKYTLIDFWASWCAPCLAEMPNIIHQYALYQSKGFEIYGISLDNNKNNWQAAVKRYYMAWIQVSDLKGWQSAACAKYNVKSIPAMFLVNQKGEIIAKDLRGEALANTLSTLFN
ncbi:MAG: AhpC/TSA family protein [Bacteroidales bacterium]|nr:AhpC/TSA family protein [Bacteroidales bacterium]